MAPSLTVSQRCANDVELSELTPSHSTISGDEITQVENALDQVSNPTKPSQDDHPAIISTVAASACHRRAKN
jgi:hypothetical protein